jgi:putative DNA primase/helicase
VTPQVPAALRDLRRWAHYDLVPVPGKDKPAKVPDRKVNEPSTWMTCAEADETLHVVGRTARGRSIDYRHAGLAFLLGDGWAGVDLDHVTLLPDHAESVLSTMGEAYREPSVSGGGVHVVGRAARLGFEIDYRQVPPKVTPWTTARFFVFTGGGTGDPATDISKAVDLWAPPREVLVPSGTTEGFRNAQYLNDNELLCWIMQCRNAEKFARLFRGEWQGDYASQSEADLALCCTLAFWTNGDLERVDRIFRTSGLDRRKWNQPSYRNSTLRKAVGR